MDRALEDIWGSNYLRSFYVDNVIKYFDSRLQNAEFTADHWPVGRVTWSTYNRVAKAGNC